MSQAAWRALNKRKRVPGKETNMMIARAIKKVAADLQLPADKIKSDNIRNLLKSGRIPSQIIPLIVVAKRDLASFTFVLFQSDGATI